MIPSSAGNRFSPWMGALVLLLAVATSASVWSTREGVIPRLVDELRELKTQRIFFAHALGLLDDNQSVVSNVTKKPASIDSLTLSLIESTNQQAVGIQAEISFLSVTNSTDMRASSNADSDVLYFLRIEFAALIERADDLLWLFEGVREVADWRPMEVRGCSLTQEDELAGLHAVCTIDVYYFPELDA